MIFEFTSPLTESDERSEFANYACELLVSKYDRDLTLTLNNVGPLYAHFDNNVRNIYHFIDSEIPLFSLYDLMRHGRDNWGLSDNEYNTAKQSALRACVSRYNLNMISVLEWESKNIK